MKKNKYFIITVDTEGDDLWNYIPGTEVQTKNACFIQPFQDICNKYGFKPVYLTNYEMLKSEEYIDFAKKNRDECEIGLHLHAWNNPPFYELEHKYSGNAYLIEYPKNVMREKFANLYNLYVEKFGHKPISHRSGRWAMNQDYFDILEEYGLKVDCSYTPGIFWKTDCGQSVPSGSDYSDEDLHVSMVGNIMEIPMSVQNCRFLTTGSWKHVAKCLITGQLTWVRTSMSRVADIMGLMLVLDKRKDIDYIEFMIHSSELMPGGSPYFKTREDVKRHLAYINEVFKYASTLGYKGVTLEEYYNLHNG